MKSMLKLVLVKRIHRCKCIRVMWAYMICTLWKKWKWNQRFILLSFYLIKHMLSVLKNSMQVNPYNIEHQNKNYGGLHMHMVQHCILSNCGSLDTKWDESRSKLQNRDFHSNVLSTYLLKFKLGKWLCFKTSKL